MNDSTSDTGTPTHRVSEMSAQQFAPHPPHWLRLRGSPLLIFVLAATLFAGCAIGGTSSTSTSPQGASATIAVPPSAQDLQQTVINVIRTVQPSVVQVTSQGSQGSGGIGSGEILTKDGYIVTNNHVVEGFTSFSVRLANNQTYQAQLTGTAPGDDLAVLKINATNLQPINMADSSKLQVGQFSIAIGSPLGLQQSATIGIVSALNRSANEGQTTLVGMIQTSAPINPGNSGGALVDLQARLIGIPTLAAVDPNSGSAANGIGFAIASNRVVYVADQLIKNGKLVSTGEGFLGIKGEDVTPQLASAYNLAAQSGVLVTDFVNDASGKSPAQIAGIKTNDIIVSVNGQQIANSSDLSSQLQTRSPGTQVTVTVVRGSSKTDFKVTLGERPTS